MSNAHTAAVNAEIHCVESGTFDCETYHAEAQCIYAKHSLAGIDTCLVEFPPGRYMHYKGAEPAFLTCVVAHSGGRECGLKPITP